MDFEYRCRACQNCQFPSRVPLPTLDPLENARRCPRLAQPPRTQRGTEGDGTETRLIKRKPCCLAAIIVTHNVFYTRLSSAPGAEHSKAIQVRS